MAFTVEEINDVWEKGNIVPAKDPEIWRQDACGAWIHKPDYGNRKSKYGWKIDRISSAGPDDLFNLRPLQWENHLSKSDGKLVCIITASGKINVDSKK